MANTQLQKTFSGAGNRKTFTLSFWVKRTKLSTGMYVFNVGNQEANPQAGLEFQGNDTLTFWNNSGSGNKVMTTTQAFRDTNAWYHLVFSIDTTQSTASDRVKIYVNGEQITSFSTATYPDQNYDYEWNGTQRHTIGAYYNNQSYFDGILSHIHFIDGTAYPASTFGSTDSTTGEWKINTSPTVTYGTNGFFILKDGNSVTDQSGNSNNFTVAGGTLTQTEDCPSNVFATFNPLFDPSSASISFNNGNLRVDQDTSGWGTGLSSLGVNTGKFYAEFKATSVASNGMTAGIVEEAYPNNLGFVGDTGSIGYHYNGTVYNRGSSSAFGNSYAQGDIIGVAMDLTNSKLYFSKNGVFQNSGDPTSGATGTGAISIGGTSGSIYFLGQSINGSGYHGEANFGQGYFGTTAVASAGTAPSEGGIFEYDCPSGYQALCTKGINSF